LPEPSPVLPRALGLTALAATGICSMIGASVNVVPIMLQRSVPGIGAWVLPAFAVAALPAVLAALAYAILGSAMPRAGGSYVYASRALSPYLGFVASVSQWFGLSIAIGVVSYVLVPFLRDVAVPLGFTDLAALLDRGPVRLSLALTILWLFTWVNLRGLGAYERTIVPLMLAMFVLGGVVIVAGLTHDHADFAAAALARDGRPVPPAVDAPFDLRTFLGACAVLFSSFIGFDAIAQAGGEARDPSRNIPRAIAIAMCVVGGFYFAFTAAVYHTVPWGYIAREVATRDLTAPGLLGYVLAPAWTIAIVAGAAVALTNDLPAMLLSVSRLVFAWAEDGIVPRALAAVHPVRRTPTAAIVASAGMATVGVVGSHLAGDFFLGVDILITSMLVNFLLMCVAVLALPRRNPVLARAVTVLPSRRWQLPLATLGVVVIGAFLVVHVTRDLTAPGRAWWLRSTPTWLAVMAVATLVYRRETAALRRAGVDLDARFATLPPA
jgi:amino acid transporter